MKAATFSAFLVIFYHSVNENTIRFFHKRNFCFLLILHNKKKKTDIFTVLIVHGSGFAQAFPPYRAVFAFFAVPEAARHRGFGT